MSESWVPVRECGHQVRLGPEDVLTCQLPPHLLEELHTCYREGTVYQWNTGPTKAYRVTLAGNVTPP